MNEFDFGDVTRAERAFNLKSGRFWAVEASEDAAARWRNSQMRAVRFGKDGSPAGVDNLGDGQAVLLSMCVYRANKNGDLPIINPEGDLDQTELVGVSVIRSWGSRIVKPLFEWVKTVSALDEAKAKSPAELEAEIAKLQQQLDDLRSGDSAPKELPAPTAGS